MDLALVETMSDYSMSHDNKLWAQRETFRRVQEPTGKEKKKHEEDWAKFEKKMTKTFFNDEAFRAFQSAPKKEADVNKTLKDAVPDKPKGEPNQQVKSTQAAARKSSDVQ